VSRPRRRHTRAVAVIAKEPVAGLAKTRLQAPLGAEGAARAAAAMLDDTLATLARVDAERWLYFAPAEARARMARLAPGFKLLAQAGGDLGDRLAGCFEALLADPDGAGLERLCVVGADTPHVPASACTTALAMLDRVDVALGPAADGGYYLVAARASLPGLFVGVPMGTGRVLEVTLRRAARAGLRVGLLPLRRDLDRVEDLAEALRCGDLDRCPRTRTVVAELLEATGAGRR
jgi:uncharacterized protein